MRARRRTHRRIAVAIAVLATWIAGSALGVPGKAPSARAAPLFLKVGKAHPASFLPSLNGKKPIFILVLGSDARPGEPVARSRADSIHILGINPRKHRASLLGFPRDAFVDIPGRGKDKITSAMYYGGPELMVDTIEGVTGMRMDYYALTSFTGLKQTVDAIGGVVVDVPYPMHDFYSRVDLEAGVQRLSGGQALAFARNRHDVPEGDFSRSENQGLLMLSALAQFQKEFEKDPSRMLTWIGAGLRNIETDLPLSDVLDLSFTALTVDADTVTNEVVAGSIATIGDKSVVLLTSAAPSLYADMESDGLLT